MISKDRYDVSLLFLSYLTYLGNSTKVAIALNLRPEEVEVLAAKENWAAKLNVYTSTSRIDPSASGEKALRRVAVEILARHLQHITGRVIEHLNSAPDAETLIRWLSPATAKGKAPVFQAGVLVDLSRALLLLNQILVDPECDGELPPSFWEAISGVMDGADAIPGLDSVALVRESLETWRTNTTEALR